jgi:hypothetical protein
MKMITHMLSRESGALDAKVTCRGFQHGLKHVE